MHGWPSIWRRRKWVSRRFVYSSLTNCSEIFVFGSYWETWYFVVCEQTCSCGHEMDKSMWQTIGAFDLVYSSHKWTQAILSCGKHSTTMQTWIVARLDFAGDLEDSKSISGRILCIFGSHTFVPISWMCKKQTSVSHSSTKAEIIFGRTVMGKAIWENPIAARLGEGCQLGMLIRTLWKRIILICVCGWH